VLAACACCYSLGIPVHAIKIGIEEIKPFPGRLEAISAVKGATVIDDSYNANPSSMKEAIDVLLLMKGTRILVIGDMAELGDDTNKYHQELGDYIQASKIDFTLAIGRHTKLTMQQLGKKEFWFDSKDALVSKLLKVMDSKSTVLVKGSRFMKMEDIVNKLKVEK
jgi:UDP-N-acetylmuramoyl-tripeptide--D-alanyl-D-alanine ligase